MRKSLIILVFSQFIWSLCYSQNVKLDTIYYDKDWKVVSSPVFASFYRVYDANEKSLLKKRFRDYYITGELQAEGGFFSFDKNDDSQSVFNGEHMTYYKSGKIEIKCNYKKGVLDGEYYSYYENGLVFEHTTYSNGKINGILTQFNEQGDICTQLELINDEPRYDYYVVSNKDGYSSKIRIKDKTPIYESPDLGEMKIEYRDGINWLYYTKNGLLIATTNTLIKDYGKWFQISILIANNSIFPIEFDPEKITSTLKKKNGQTVALEVWSSDKYLRKVRKTQNWNMVLAGISEGIVAANAGYSTSTTRSNTFYNGYSNTYGSAYAHGPRGTAYGNFSGSGTYFGNTSTTSRTTTYDGAAAYQAQVIASNRMANYENSLLQERAIKQEGYLKKNTIYPGNAVSGYVNIQRIKGSSMTVRININGAIYEFPWTISD